MCFSSLREAARWYDWLWVGGFCMLMSVAAWEFINGVARQQG